MCKRKQPTMIQFILEVVPQGFFYFKGEEK